MPRDDNEGLIGASAFPLELPNIWRKRTPSRTARRTITSITEVLYPAQSLSGSRPASLQSQCAGIEPRDLIEHPCLPRCRRPLCRHTTKLPLPDHMHYPMAISVAPVFA